MNDNLVPKSLVTFEEFDKFLEYDNTSTRYELVHGDIVAQARPSSLHQEIMSTIDGQLYALLQGKNCKATTEHAVRLNFDEPTEYVPDIVILCDKDRDKRKKNFIEGAPTIVVEIWSPGNRWTEMMRKHQDYLQAGVTELWEINLKEKSICVCNKEQTHWSSFEEGIGSIQFPGLHIDMSEFKDVEV